MCVCTRTDDSDDMAGRDELTAGRDGSVTVSLRDRFVQRGGIEFTPVSALVNPA
jgi:hypothetical protein